MQCCRWASSRPQQYKQRHARLSNKQDSSSRDDICRPAPRLRPPRTAHTWAHVTVSSTQDPPCTLSQRQCRGRLEERKLAYSSTCTASCTYTQKKTIVLTRRAIKRTPRTRTASGIMGNWNCDCPCQRVLNTRVTTYRCEPVQGRSS